MTITNFLFLLAAVCFWFAGLLVALFMIEYWYLVFVFVGIAIPCAAIFKLRQERLHNVDIRSN